LVDVKERAKAEMRASHLGGQLAGCWGESRVESLDGQLAGRSVAALESLKEQMGHASALELDLIEVDAWVLKWDIETAFESANARVAESAERSGCLDRSGK